LRGMTSKRLTNSARQFVAFGTGGGRNSKPLVWLSTGRLLH
jgi:hypothetical protein